MERKSVLIIDDDNRNVFALSAVLKAKGYPVIAAQEARAGIKMLEDGASVSIVLMDMMMPDIDGYEAIGLIKANKKLAGIPIVAVTAQAMVGDRERCMDAGADEYLSKPVDVDLLVRLLNKYL